MNLAPGRRRAVGRLRRLLQHDARRARLQPRRAADAEGRGGRQSCDEQLERPHGNGLRGSEVAFSRLFSACTGVGTRIVCCWPRKPRPRGAPGWSPPPTRASPPPLLNFAPARTNPRLPETRPARKARQHNINTFTASRAARGGSAQFFEPADDAPHETTAPRTASDPAPLLAASRCLPYRRSPRPPSLPSLTGPRELRTTRRGLLRAFPRGVSDAPPRRPNARARGARHGPAARGVAPLGRRLRLAPVLEK